MRFIPALAAFAILGCATTAQASIVYTFTTTITSATPTGNPNQSDTISGSLTTDGTIGVIKSSNIQTYSLALIDNLNNANTYTLTPLNSTIVNNTGSALSATATALSFNFSGSGEFLIQANTPGPFSGNRYFCFSTGGACAPGETIAPQSVFADGVTTTGSSIPSGAQAIGTLPSSPPSPPIVSAVPEPATLSLILASLAATTLTRRRKA